MVEPLVNFLGSAPKGLSRLERMLLLEQRFFLADHNLIYTTRCPWRGVETRVPFLIWILSSLCAYSPLQAVG